jgi:hypothetical protein
MSNSSNIWTSEELNTLSSKYPVMAVKHLQGLIPRHTVIAIYRKAKELNIRAYPRKCDYSAYLYANAGQKTIDEMCEEMNCCRSTAYRRMRQLGISFYNPLSL